MLGHDLNPICNWWKVDMWAFEWSSVYKDYAYCSFDCCFNSCYVHFSVQSPAQVKITDFGLSKLLDFNEEHFQAAGGKVSLFCQTNEKHFQYAASKITFNSNRNISRWQGRVVTVLVSFSQQRKNWQSSLDRCTQAKVSAFISNQPSHVVPML